MTRLIISLKIHFRISTAAVAAAILSSCAGAPPVAPASVAKCSVCEACQVCVAPTLAGATPAAISTPKATPVDLLPPAVLPQEPSRGRLERASWEGLPSWNTDDPTEALVAFMQSCRVLAEQVEWSAVCAAGANLASKPNPEGIRRYFREGFEPFKVINADESQTGVVTGYYEPLLRGSRTRTAIFKYPIYSQPQDLVTIDLNAIYPDFKFKQLRGRIVGNKLVPYFDRSEIESSNNPLKGLELAWVDNEVELFFLHIQGSGQIFLPDGTRMRVGYADQNGHAFRSLGGTLIRRKLIKPEQASMQGIKDWARKNPEKLQQFMNVNASYVFFKELPNGLTGPIGTLGVPLTQERSLAVDQRVIPLGVPVYLATTAPNTKKELNRLMVAQDTGGAINGAVRADYYWGFGDGAGSQAGRMKQQGRMWVLLPKGYDPNADKNSPLASAVKTL